MNTRFLHFCANFTCLAALLAQCLALPSAPSKRTTDCEGFDVTIANNRTEKGAQYEGPLNAYVSGQRNDKYGMLAWSKDGTEWHELAASTPVHETANPPNGKYFAIPIPKDKKNVTFCMPKDIISGRVYIVEGTLDFKVYNLGSKTLVDEPSAVANGFDAYNKRWSFLEFTYTKDDDIVVNLSFVDWVSLTLGFSLTTSNGTDNVPGLQPGGLVSVCDGMETQSEKDGKPEWASLCVKHNGKLLRVLSPNQYATLNNETWKEYYDAYWSAFKDQMKDNKLVINTQDDGKGGRVGDGKEVTCSIKDEEDLACTTSTASQTEFVLGHPNHITDIWGCDKGMFSTDKFHDFSAEDRNQFLEVVPRVCAAMVRSTLLLDGGHIQPNPAIQPDKYYKPGNDKDDNPWPTNHYSRVVHEFLQENKGYAFAFDDVDPLDVNSAGLIEGNGPITWNITLSD